MRHGSWLTVVAAGALVALLGYVIAQDDPKPTEPASPPERRISEEQLEPTLEYLSSSVPEHQVAAERLLRRVAERYFARLVELLPSQPRRGREKLLEILTATEAKGRVRLCIDTLSRQDAWRTERVTAARALRELADGPVEKEIRARLQRGNVSTYQRVQYYRVLGSLESARAQDLAERQLKGLETGHLIHFFAEDALLRSILANPFAEAAWGRYQRRQKDAPQVTLKVLQRQLDDLSLPLAADRVMAEIYLEKLIGKDDRLLLALARSAYTERSLFALTVLKSRPRADLALATQAVMLDLVTSGEQVTALLAVDVAIAGTPPTPDELDKLRPTVSADAMTRLEAVLERLSSGSNLAELRASRRKVALKLHPLLLRFGPFNGEVIEVRRELASLEESLEQVEASWRWGWRREFEDDILGRKRG